MNFCPECESMLYYQDENEVLYETCKDCGYKKKCENHIIESKVYNTKKIKNDDNKNNTRYDNSLPRTIHKKCPNEKCDSRKKPELQEAVYYSDQTTLKAVYICVICNTQWQYS